MKGEIDIPAIQQIENDTTFVKIFGKLPSDDAFNALIQKLGQLPNLTKFLLKNADIGDAGLQRLADVLKNSKLEHLSLVNNQLTAKGMETLVEILYTLSNLKTLDLRDNPHIKDEGARILAQAIEKNRLPKLKTIFLQHNSIGDKGAIDLLSALVSLGLPSKTIQWGEGENRFKRKSVQAAVKAKHPGKSLGKVWEDLKKAKNFFFPLDDPKNQGGLDD